MGSSMPTMMDVERALELGTNPIGIGYLHTTLQNKLASTSRPPQELITALDLILQQKNYVDKLVALPDTRWEGDSSSVYAKQMTRSTYQKMLMDSALAETSAQLQKMEHVTLIYSINEQGQFLHAYQTPDGQFMPPEDKVVTATDQILTTWLESQACCSHDGLIYHMDDHGALENPMTKEDFNHLLFDKEKGLSSFVEKNVSTFTLDMIEQGAAPAPRETRKKSRG